MNKLKKEILEALVSPECICFLPRPDYDNLLSIKKARESVPDEDCSGHKYTEDEKEDIARFMQFGAEIQLTMDTDRLSKPKSESMLLSNKTYCVDCIHFGAKRSSDGSITGETMCFEWRQLRTCWQSCDSYFDTKSEPLIRADEAQNITNCVKDAKRVHPDWGIDMVIELLQFRTETRQALKKGEADGS